MTVWARSNQLFLVVLLVIVALTVGIASQLSSTSAHIRMGNQSFAVQIADTVVKRSQGLSGQSGLKQNHGLLFVFDPPERSCFWMKDMLFAIDILWFDAANKLVYEKRNASPESYPELFCPPTEAKYVVEVRAGTAQALGLKLGDQLKLL